MKNSSKNRNASNVVPVDNISRRFEKSSGNENRALGNIKNIGNKTKKKTVIQGVSESEVKSSNRITRSTKIRKIKKETEKQKLRV